MGSYKDCFISKSKNKKGNRRILYIIGSLAVGGAERHVVQVAIRLKELGWETEVFVLYPGGPLTDALTKAKVPVYGFFLPNVLSLLLKNARLRAWTGMAFTAFVLITKLWFRRPAILHFFLPAAYIFGGLLSFFTFGPAKIMSRRSLRNYQAAYPLFTKIEHFLHPRMDLVCGNSLAVVTELEAEGLEAHRLRLIYNGIDFSLYNQPFDRKGVRAKFEIPEEAIVFVIVANLIPYKGHSDLIRALASVKGKLPEPWILLCLGRDDGIGADLQREAEYLGIATHIRFLGSRTDVPDFLRLADVGLLCSHEEGFSNAVLECMAAGLPMVVTDVGGNAEAVLDGVTGYVVPARAPKLLGDAVLRMVLDGRRHVMGEKGRQRAMEKFSMSACIDAYEAMYCEATAGICGGPLVKN